VNFFLKKFPSTEWSGPAWYKPILKKDERYPEGFKLVHFHPVDLGHGTSTTIEAGDTAKILEKTWKDYPETEKCMMGIIHSHHTMGAFFSGTDKNCLEDNAPQENFYCSTVVASKKEQFAFGVAYKDQFERVHLDIADEGSTQMILPADKEESKWSYIAKKIEKAKKETTVTGYYGRGGRYNQGSFWSNVNNKPINGYGNPINYQDENPDEEVIMALQQKANLMEDPENGMIALLTQAYQDKKILYETFRDELELFGIDSVPYLETWNEPHTGKGGTNVIALPETSKKSGLDSPKTIR